LVELLNQERQFDIGQEASQTTHDNLEQEFINLYNDATAALRTHLVYLRQEVAVQSKDARVLQEEQKAASQARKQSEEILQQLKKDLEDIKKETKNVEEAKGERAATIFGKHFELQAEQYAKRATQWGGLRLKFFVALLTIIVGNFLVYFYLFVTDKAGWWPRFSPNELFTIEYGVVKIALLGVLFYAVNFASKNYSVSSNLEAVNSHRKNVAATLRDFLSSTNPNPEDRAQIVRSGAEAMFRQSSSGYIQRNEPKDEGTLREIINNFPLK
jgi:hypothetical protein